MLLTILRQIALEIEMTEAILRGEYYYATVEDRPGVLYNVLEHLRQKNVRLLAFTVFPPVL